MSEAAASQPPLEASRDELIEYYRALAATPHTTPAFGELRRQGREGLTLLCASPVEAGFSRRRRWLVSTHFRAKRPSGRIKRA
jgi:hypothetical protein